MALQKKGASINAPSVSILVDLALSEFVGILITKYY